MSDFTPDQLSAIEYRMLDACVVAGPGSGKTTVLVERFKRLVRNERFQPSQILAITFTEKAAANMKAKLAKEFHDDPARLRELERGWVSTIHGFCNRLLRENAIAAGLDPRFSVLDESQSESLRSACMSSALDSLLADQREAVLALIAVIQAPMFLASELKSVYDAILAAGKTIEQVRVMPSPQGVAPGAKALAVNLRTIVRGWSVFDLKSDSRRDQAHALLEWADRLQTADGLSFGELSRLVEDCPLHLGKVPKESKEALKEFRVSLEIFASAAVDANTAPYRALIFEVLRRFDVLYAQRKAELGALDFNDLERRSIEMLRTHNDVRAGVTARFRQIMLDEYQDINEQQAELVRLIRGEDSFFAVGDPNQSIYGFRHARPEIFRDYREEVQRDAKHSAELFHNFRSRAPILRVVEAVLNGARGIDRRELVSARVFPPKPAPAVEVIRAVGLDSEAAAEREAKWIAHRILELRGTLELGAPETHLAEFRDFAVLCRTGDSMQPLLDTFDNVKIPYVCGRRQSFLEQREGLDIRAALHTISNPRDEVSLATMLRSQLVGLSDEALLRLKLGGHSLVSGFNLVARDRTRLAAFEGEDHDKLEAFARNLKRWRADQRLIPLDVLITRVLTESGFRWSPNDTTGENVEEFLRLARTRGSDRSLSDFLVELEGVADAASKEAELSDEDQGNRVQVMTTHAAKGLEFPVTIVAAIDTGGRQGSPPVSFTPENGLGLRWKDKKEDRGLKDTWAKANADRLKVREDDEAHRLLYVAMTRAEEHLILSYSTSGKSPGYWAKMIDEFFQLKDRQPSPEPFYVQASGVDALVRIADVDPPTEVLELHSAAADAIAVARPEIAEQHDTTVNVTSLTTFAACPRKYYLQRYIGWSGTRGRRFDPEDLPLGEEEGPKTAAELGTMVHEILAGKAGQWPQVAVELAARFGDSELGRRAAAADRVEHEWDFIAEIEATLVRGTVDLWFQDERGRVIVDYKTDDVNAAEAIARAREYAPQLALYAIALGESRAFLHFLRPNVVVEVPVDAVAQSNARRLIAELRSAQNSLGFNLWTGEHCNSCPFYRGLCPANLSGIDEEKSTIEAE